MIRKLIKKITHRQTVRPRAPRPTLAMVAEDVKVLKRRTAMLFIIGCMHPTLLNWLAAHSDQISIIAQAFAAQVK